MDKEMQKALEADGEKLRQLTGEDHGPWTGAEKIGQLAVDRQRLFLERLKPDDFFRFAPLGRADFLGVPVQSLRQRLDGPAQRQAQLGGHLLALGGVRRGRLDQVLGRCGAAGGGGEGAGLGARSPAGLRPDRRAPVARRRR